jgi:hypothetical protein
MRKAITLLCTAFTIWVQAQSILPTDGLVVHIPFTNNSTDVNGNYTFSTAQLGIFPTIAGNWLNTYPLGTAKRENRLLNSNAISLTGTNAITAPNLSISGSAFSIGF